MCIRDRYMGDAEKDSMKKDIAITKAVDLIMDNVKERAKAKKKADACLLYTSRCV